MTERGSSWPTAEQLMREASEQVGLDDFGKPTFRLGLDHLLASLEEADLSADARAMIAPVLKRRLVNRLKIEQWFAENPDAETAQIRGPISITGLPRTGTTALANMMSLDPQFRPLRMWEQIESTPPPELATEKDDPRRKREMDRIQTLANKDPMQMVMHLYDVDATVEDHEVLGLEFRSQQGTWPVFNYNKWWRTSDMRDTFAYHSRVLRLLQSRRPPNLWLLKAPHHSFYLDAIADVYPDARFIFTHRDPVKAVPSYISFATSLYPPGAVERHGLANIGVLLHEHMLEGMQRAVAARKALGPERFLDVTQQEIDREPIPMLERIYAFLGLTFTPAFQAEVERWSAVNRSGAHGAHHYTPEQFGLSADRIRSDYAFYLNGE